MSNNEIENTEGLTEEQSDKEAKESENLEFTQDILVSPGDDEPDEVIVYKKDRPLFTLVRNMTITLLVAVSLLFFTGIAMGLLGIRPPSLDSKVIQDQWNKVTQGDVQDSEWNELERNDQ